MRQSKNLKKWKRKLPQTHIENFSQHVWTFRLSSLKPTMGKIRTTCLCCIKVWYDLILTIFGVTEMCSFTLVLEKKEITEWSRLEFLEKFSASYSTLSEAKDNTFVPLLNRWGIADWYLLRILLANCQRSLEPSFWEVIDSFVLLASASATILI